MSLDAADDLTGSGSDLYLRAEQFLGLGNSLALDNLAYLELQLCKIIIGNFCLRLQIDPVLSFFILIGSFVLFGCLCGLKCLRLFKHLFYIHTGKEDLRLVRHLMAGWIQAKGIKLIQAAFLCF